MKVTNQTFRPCAPCCVRARWRCISCRFLGGSAFKNKGVQPLLNAVIDYLPSPLDVVDYMGFKPGDETETRNIARRADDNMPFSALAFKIMNDPVLVGSLTFTRVYSGVLNKGDTLLNSTQRAKKSALAG